jgi:hypothetical protein
MNTFNLLCVILIAFLLLNFILFPKEFGELIGKVVNGYNQQVTTTCK